MKFWRVSREFKNDFSKISAAGRGGPRLGAAVRGSPRRSAAAQRPNGLRPNGCVPTEDSEARLWILRLKLSLAFNFNVSFTVNVSLISNVTSQFLVKLALLRGSFQVELVSSKACPFTFNVSFIFHKVTFALTSSCWSSWSNSWFVSWFSFES